MLNAICITTNRLEHVQTNLCIHLSYLEDQRNLKIYNKNIEKKKKMFSIEISHPKLDTIGIIETIESNGVVHICCTCFKITSDAYYYMYRKPSMQSIRVF